MKNEETTKKRKMKNKKMKKWKLVNCKWKMKSGDEQWKMNNG
jgi:hypothetical protein